MLWGILASLILIFFIYLTAKIWIWIYKNAFWIQNYKKLIFISLFIWWIAAGSILLFPKICSYFWLETFTSYYFSWKTLWIFMFYLNLLLVITSLLFWKFSKQQFLNLLIFNTYFIILYTFFSKLWLDQNILNVILYYLFVAYWEELVKNQLAFSMYNKTKKVESDLLLYHILAAIWFAFWENIVYLTWIIWFQTFLATLLGWIWIVITRWIIWFGAHTFYSSMIWMWNILWFLSILFFILLGMLIHYGYDLSLYFQYKWIIPIFIIIIYFWISWVFYKIDRLYLE